MKTIFDKLTRDELIDRINSLNENSKPHWGKMNVYQMIKHCSLWGEMTQGNKKYKRSIIGFFFGKAALKDFIKDASPFPKNVPGLAELKAKETTGDINCLKENYVKTIENYADFSNITFIHPFFGKMTKEQVGLLAYKHNDHHLRQFGV